MDSYKIVFDTEGKAFSRIHTLSNMEGRRKEYSKTRAILAHAKGRGVTLPEIRKTHRELLDQTLDLLEIVKFEFIDSRLQMLK